MALKIGSICLLTTLLFTHVAFPDQEETISLSGEWAFALDPDDEGEKGKWFDKPLRQKIALPGSTAVAGHGNDVTVDTEWTGAIIDRSWYTDNMYAEYRQPGNVKVPFWLTPVKHYVGPAWYVKEIEVPGSWEGKKVRLFLERCHWETRVWADGKFVGTRNSLSTPHLYELPVSPGKHRLAVRVDNTVKINVGVNAHSVSDHTQSNWNGIVGRIELQAFDPVWIEDIQLYPSVEDERTRVRIQLRNDSEYEAEGTLTLMMGQDQGPSVRFTSPAGGVELEAVLRFEESPRLWDEFSPNLHVITAVLNASNEVGKVFTGEKQVRFGVRSFTAKGTRFHMNGRPVFLRGTLECCIFPLTGYPPMHVDAWLEILEKARAHGLNHLRFHSWCPPEAAFEAADRMGFIFQVECPFWTTVGDGGAVDEYLYEEGRRILQAYGNHPSFCMLASGNEPGGKNQRRFLGDLVSYWKERDGRRLYTSASGWPLIPENDFHSTFNPRIHLWGAGLNDRLNDRPPATDTDYRRWVSAHEKPLVSHEIGQWCVYPNFEEIGKYTGVLKAYNFEIIRDRLAANHMLDQARDFLMASGKLQALCYKEEIESALRTPGFGGFQLLDVHDFPGQGTALVGVLDPFWDSKGYITPEEFRRFCGPTVLLARMGKRILTQGEIFFAELEIANFGAGPLEGAVPRWSITGKDGVFDSGELPQRDIPVGNGLALGEIAVPIVAIETPQKLKLTVSLGGSEIENDWDLWIFPKPSDAGTPEGILITDTLDEKALESLGNGGKVLLMPPPGYVRGKVPPAFSSIFWNTAWTRRQPPHTLGILCDPAHPALSGFPTEYHSNWQWWGLVTRAQAMVLDGLPPELRPIVQVIDDWFTNRRLGLVFEAGVNGGKLLVCSIDLAHDLADRPAARQMRASLLGYMESDAFDPGCRLEAELVNSLFTPGPALMKLAARIIHVDSEVGGLEARKCMDGDPATIWHTPWSEGSASHPHEIQIDLGQSHALVGFTCLPRQDQPNGRVGRYAFFVSNEISEWREPEATGEFENSADLQTVRFDAPVQGRYIRFVAYSEVNGNPFTSVAELDVIVEKR